MLVPIYALFVTSIGGTIFHASLVAAVFYLTAGVGSMIMGRILMRVKNKRLTLIIGYLVLAAGYALLLGTNGILYLVLVQVFLGIGESIATPSFDTLFTKHLVPHHESEEWGAWESTRYLTMFTGSFLGGAIAFYAGFPILFSLMAGMCLVSAIYLLFIPKKLL